MKSVVTDLDIKNKVVTIFGGVSAVARIIGKSASAVSQWKSVPLKHQRTLLEYAQSHSMNFSSEDFFCLGRREVFSVRDSEGYEKHDYLKT